MKLMLSPIRGLPGQAATRLSVSGDVLLIDGVAIDFGPLVPEAGAFLPDAGDHPLLGTVTRRDGEIEVALLYVLDESAAADQPALPEHWQVQVTEGDVPCPALPASTVDEELDQ